MKLFKEVSIAVEHEHDGKSYKVKFKPASRLDFYDLHSEVPSQVYKRLFDKVVKLEVKEGNKSVAGEHELPLVVVNAIAEKYITQLGEQLSSEASEKNSQEEQSAS